MFSHDGSNLFCYYCLMDDPYDKNMPALAPCENLPGFRVVEGEIFKPNIERSGLLAIEIRVTFDAPIIIEGEFTVDKPVTLGNDGCLLLERV